MCTVTKPYSITNVSNQYSHVNVFLVFGLLFVVIILFMLLIKIMLLNMFNRLC